ncbi:MAG: glutamine-hydrolyzing GMP synthase [Candidatus Odinarchaeota archaeon]
MERVLIVDFGGQYTHLISRRCRELGVYTEIIPQDLELDGGKLKGVRGVIFSGSPRTVSSSDLDATFQNNLRSIFNREIKILGICFGHHLLAVYHGAELESGGNPEYGKTEILVKTPHLLLNALELKQEVWMSHSDEIRALPENLITLAISKNDRIAAFADNENKFFGVQFHPEVTHTPNGLSVLDAFLRKICKYEETWRPENQINAIIEYINTTVKESRVLMGTSGGVDSTVAAYLLKQAIGDRLFCVFVDNGLLRTGENQEVAIVFRNMGFENFIVVDASEEFIEQLRDVEDPEEKRRIIAETFIRVFERKAMELEREYGKFEFLGQGTIYPDRVESAATGKSTAVIKSHHNVRLPDWMKLKLVEPLKDLYKDEVRLVGIEMRIPQQIISRQPFPGPSLAIRISGPVTRDQLAILRHADSILQEVLERQSFYHEIWQSFCILLPTRTVGVKGDERTFEQAVVIRAVESRDAMTASVSKLPWEVLLHAASRIANEVPGVNRVVYDLTSKPPGTIEWY